VSSDTSPPSGFRLDNPARTAGATGASPGAAPSRQTAATPSWIRVIGTTLRLWVRRRILRVPDTGRIGTGRLAGVAALVVVVVVGAAAAILVAVTGSPASPASPAPRRHPVTDPKLTPAQQQARAKAAALAVPNDTAAAGWIASEVSQLEVIGCDPATCAAIQTAGYGGAAQIVLQPGVKLPAAGALVVATPAVRALYGAKLAAAAPAVIAVFGTGAEAVQVRIVVPGGQVAYSQAASSAIAASHAAGASLLANGNVRVRAAARQALTAGLVDARLLTVLGKLAAQYPILISRFSDTDPLGDNSVPYRMAEIVGLTATHARHRISQLAGVEALLQSQLAGDQATVTPVPLANGRYGLTIQFPAPSPA
jgi:hypothetical protein